MTTRSSQLQSANDASKIIADAAARATDAIATAAESALKVVTAAAAGREKAANVQLGSNMEDHNLLIQLNTKMEDLKEDIAELKNGTSSRIQQLEAEKLNTRDSYPVLYKKGVDDAILDHEKRIRLAEVNLTRITTWGVAAMIALSIAEFMINKFM